MKITESMRSVMIRIKRLKTDKDLVSPNYVADLSFQMKKYLTSEQIVYISDNI